MSDRASSGTLCRSRNIPRRKTGPWQDFSNVRKTTACCCRKRRRMRLSNFLPIPSCCRTHAVMDFLLPLSVLLLLLRQSVAAGENQDIQPRAVGGRKSSPLHPIFKRSTPHRISECVYVTSEENVYLHSSEDGSDAVCGIYLFTDADKVIEVHFEEVDVPCESGGLVTFFDGWELNGKFFPGVDDHEKAFGERYQEFCGHDRTERVFKTTQNAGMIHYRVPAKGKGFSFYLTFARNPAPCNILVESKEDFYTLRNHGRATNCTLIAVFPAKVKVLALDVGVVTPMVETGTIYQCKDKRMTDGLQIGGSDDLDSSRIVLFEDICGLDSSPGMGELVVGCGVSIVRLVSSGHFENSATVSIGQPEEMELLRSTLRCGVEQVSGSYSRLGE